MSFATLPYELQTSIISQLLLPPSSGTDFAFSTASPPPRLNQHRAAILARVSQGCNSLITSVLYRHIWIAKPSALRRLHATFARRPDLATLVRSIHLGPAAELPAKGWPILLGGTPEGRLPELSIKTSVSWGHEEDLWPLWCRPGDASGLKDPSADNCENFAITQALKGAQRDLDVEPWRRGYSRSGRYIGSRRWAQRLYLLQAVLDLYLVEIRRADDERDYDIIEGRPPRRPMGQHKTARACKISLCGHYPRLRVLDGPASSAADLGGGGEVLDVTTAQLWQLLERPGGAGDHFDNILFLAQSTRSALDLGEDEWHKVFSLFGGPHGDRLSDAQWRQTTGNHSAVAADAPDPLHDPDEVGQETGGNDDGDICVARGSSNEDWHSARSDQADAALGGHSFQVEDLINSARSVLLRATKASNVSLTSYLYRALPALPHPHLLRSINIGPFPDWWSYDFLDALAKRMPTLVGMRIVGKLSLRDAAALCLELPALKELRWIWPSDVALPLEARVIVSLLQGQITSPLLGGQGRRSLLERHRQPLDDEADDNIGSSTGSESSEAEYFSPSEGEGNLTPPRCAWPHRTTTIFLHPNAAPARLSSATVSQNVRDAWRAGRRVPGALHPVKVVEIELERGWNGEISDGAMEALTALLYAEGKTWWQEGRARVGGYGDVA